MAAKRTRATAALTFGGKRRQAIGRERADGAPADFRFTKRRATQHDLHARPRTSAVDEIEAVFDGEVGALGGECPDLAIVDQDAAGSALRQALTAAIRMQVEVDRIRQIGLEAKTALRRLQAVDAFDGIAVLRKADTAEVHQAEALRIAIVAAGKHSFAALIAEAGCDHVRAADRQSADNVFEFGVAYKARRRRFGEAQRVVAGGGARDGIPSRIRRAWKAAIDENKPSTRRHLE